MGWTLAGVLVLLWLTPLWGMGTVEGAGVGTVLLTTVGALVVVWLLVVRPARRGGGLASPVVATSDAERPVDVPERVEGRVQACMRCGSRDLSMPGLRDGVWLGGGELQFLVCRRCNTRAPPLEFERGEDYVAFVKDLHAR